MGKGEIKLETYKRSTNIIKTRFEKILTKVTSLLAVTEATPPLTQVQVRALNTYLTEVRKKRADFEGNCQRIIEHEGEDISESELSSDIDSINDLYVEIVSQIESLLPPEDPLSPTSAANSSFQHMPSAQQHVRLPQLDLKTFNGDVSNWVAYINLFDATVHQNPTLSSVLKFQYLLSSLTDEPLSLIKSLNISAANYPIAYQLLRDRYHNARRLSTLHLNAILDLPNITVGHTKGLRNFLNSFAEHTQSLGALNCDITTAVNPLLSAHLLRKLDQELRKKLEHFRSSQECDIHSLPTVKHIIQFLNDECNQTEDASLHFPQSNNKQTNSQYTNKHNKTIRFADQKPHSSRSHALTVSSTSGQDVAPLHSSHTCFACNQTGHKIYSCPFFMSKTPNERSKIVKANKRCYSCLGSHMINVCTSKNVCNVCQKKHHSMLHFDRKSGPVSTPNQAAPSQPSLSQPPQDMQSYNTLVANSVARSNSRSLSNEATTVLLGTALVKVTAANGNTQVLRCLIDSGSQLSFVSERAVQLLNTSRVYSSHEITGISATTSRTKGVVHLDISTLGGTLIASQHPIHILDRISSDLPRVRISSDVWQLTRPFVLADPTFDRPGRLDMLIGGALYPLLFTQESHSLGPNMPHLVGTHFGYIVVGVAPCGSQAPSASYFVALHSSCESAELHSSLQRFWIQEEPPHSSRKSTEEELCDKHFIQTHTRTQGGRYVVRLPFQPEHPPLGQSRQIAEKRLLSLERKFEAQPQLKQLYIESMRECEASKHMTKVTTLDATTPHSYLPHHGVLKISGDSAKLRVVYDGSCKTSSGFSLNDLLMTGPKLQLNISDVLLHFRTHNIVFTCDIRQMYLQILVQPPDNLFQLVMWRESTSEPMSTYSLNRVTFGVSSSPFLAIRTLHQLAEDEGQDYPEAAAVLKAQTYVDDVITGSDTVTGALKLKEQLIQLLRRGGFELRKWTSNCPDLLHTLPSSHRDNPVFLEATNEPHFSILGLHWSPDSDKFSYHLNFPSATPTKRHVLSLIARVYDPCGFLSPFIMVAKSFMQLLWTTGLGWDEPLPSNLKEKWQTFVSSVPTLSNITIPRALQLNTSLNIQLHGFSDASECGYAAVVYSRCEQATGDVIVSQLIAKTRVSPLKRVTLPRLELCAAHLLAQLVSYCCDMLKLSVSPTQCYLWCDSSVALSWLQTPSYRLKTYVANRVAQAQELVPTSCWHYIPTKDNPADCASRGILATELATHPLWWTGPPWLSLPSSHWPDISFTPIDATTLEEVKSTPLTVLTASPRVDDFHLLSKFSSWDKLRRVTAYILRFSHNLKCPDKRHGALTTSELHDATLRLLRRVQQDSFPEDLKSLKQNGSCSVRLQRLAPFMDHMGIIRVGGRLRSAQISQEAKHPIVLPKHHPVVDLLIDSTHHKYLHSGPQLTQAIITQNYWIFSARQVIRSRIFKCITCFRNKPHNSSPLMGDLPASRVTPAKPFSSTGCDFCGPFTIKVVNLKAVRHVKAYICVFICMVTKAVHLEVVTDMTTDAFLASLTRFVSRRGLCSHLFSDCGTNFVGADANLQKLWNSILSSKDSQEKLLVSPALHGITFHFNPPAAPHQGGLWESVVRSAKHHLRRVMGDTVLTLMEFITLSTQIEAMLNSRPLTPLSSDPSDCSALTPGHFLTGAPLTAVPEPDHPAVPLNRLRHWQLVQALHQRVWRQWQLSYLHMLQQRPKWMHKTPNLKIGDLVLVHMNTPPLTWPLARITAVHPGPDGVVRVVDLKTPNGSLTRPAVKVFPLPIE
jgi:hypothetical protein